jgi:hypothetical protein
MLIMQRILLYDRRLWLLSLIALATVLFGRVLLPVGWTLNAVVKGGYWVILGTSLLWGWTLVKLLGPESVKTGWGKVRQHWAILLLVFGVGGVWQAQETHGFKILADEALLLGTSQSMHLDREVGYPLRGTDVQGPFQILQGVLDKRPYFFSFLVSLVHDFTGYRTTNPFWLNTALSFVFLGLLYGLTAKAGGRRRAGVLALVLAAGLPLLAQQAAGGGFELLNLTLITGWWWLAILYVERPGVRRQDALVLTAVLLASTRYESLLFLVPTAALLFIAWWREKQVIVSWPTWVAPLLILPMLWLNRAFSANDTLWELKSLGADTPFALKYVAGNLGHALAYFFSFDGYQPNSPYLGLLGLIALPVFGLWAQRLWRAPGRSDGAEVGLAVGSLGAWAVTGLMMVYFWGQFDHPVIRRLSLPTQLLMLVAVVVVVGRAIRPGTRVWGGLIAGGLVALMAFSLPSMAKNAYGRDYSPAMAYAWRQEFLKRQSDRGFLMIDRDSYYWIAEKIAASPNGLAKIRRDGIAYHMRNHSFTAVFVFQELNVDPDTGALTVPVEEDLGPDFQLEPVAQRRVQLLKIARFSRVVAIRDGDKVLAKADLAITPLETEMTPVQIETAKREYLDRWVKELP